MALRSDGAVAAPFTNPCHMKAIQRDLPALVIELIAGTDAPALDRA